MRLWKGAYRHGMLKRVYMPMGGFGRREARDADVRAWAGPMGPEEQGRVESRHLDGPRTLSLLTGGTQTGGLDASRPVVCGKERRRFLSDCTRFFPRKYKARPLAWW